MMRNLVRILLISTALVAAPVTTAFAAISPTTLTLGGSAEASAAINEAYAALTAALASGDSVAAARAIAALQAALPATADFAAIINAMLSDLVRDAGAAGVSVTNLASVLSGVAGAVPEGTINTATIRTAATAAGYAASDDIGIGAVGGPAAGGPGAGGATGGGTPDSIGGGGGNGGTGAPVSQN